MDTPNRTQPSSIWHWTRLMCARIPKPSRILYETSAAASDERAMWMYQIMYALKAQTQTHTHTYKYMHNRNSGHGLSMILSGKYNKNFGIKLKCSTCRFLLACFNHTLCYTIHLYKYTQTHISMVMEYNTHHYWVDGRVPPFNVYTSFSIDLDHCHPIYPAFEYGLA